MILVTGGAGYIGSHTCVALCEAGQPSAISMTCMPMLGDGHAVLRAAPRDQRPLAGSRHKPAGASGDQRSERAFARSLFKEGQFVEVFVDTSLAICEQRDPKGLYAKARSGALKNFTGYDSPYEPPEQAELWIKTAGCSAIEATERLAKITLMEAL